jgi:putative membrane protein
MKRKNEIRQIEHLRKKPRFLLGLMAGIVGGLAGAAAKTVAEQIYVAREPGQAPSPELVAHQVSGRGAAGHKMHWTFSALAGGVYGMLAEVWPEITESKGAAFGAFIHFALHDSTLPATAIGPRPAERTKQAASSEVTTHAVYGITTEFVRKHMRSWLEPKEVKQPREAERDAGRNVNLRQSA